MHSLTRHLARRVAAPAALLSLFALVCASPAQPVTQFTAAVAVGQQSAPLQVTVTMIATGTPIDPEAVTQGIPNQDFSITGGTCSQDAPVTYVGQQCTADVVFTPKYPGLRLGAVLVKTSSGTLLGSALVAGVGTGPLAVLDPGVITTVVGDSEWFFAGDGGAGNQSPIHEPGGVLVDPAGNIYLSDSENYRVRRVEGALPNTITTIAGTGNPGYSGDGGQAVNAAISTPAGLAMDGAGNIYFADTGNQIIRRIGIDGVITTVAGTPQTQGYSGDGGAATAAELSLPQGVALDASGDLYIADTGNGVIREVDAATGTISTVAGVAGIANFNGDGTATASHLNQPWSVAVASDNSVYIADSGNNRIRRLSGGMLSTVVGNGAQGYGGDSGPAASATLDLPLGVALDPAGDLYIADSGNDCVRKVSASTGDVTTGSALIQTIIGTGKEGYSGDAGPANAATLHGPYVVFFAQNGDFYVADTINNRIRAIPATPVTLPQFPDTKVTKTSSPPVIEGLDSDGNADLDMSTPTLVNAALDSSTTTCSFSTATLKGSSCNLGIEFAPTTVQQNLQGSVTLNSTTATGLATIDLFGNALDVNPTTMTLVASPSPGVVNQSVTFTATVSSNDSSTPLTGPVTFVEGSNTLCSNVSLNSGRAMCSTSALALGQHTITANYAGDANNEAATASTTVNVRQQATLALSVNPSPSATVLQNVTLTITVTPPSGTATGTVIFYDGGTALTGSLPLSGGVATYSTTTLSPGQHSLTAQYAGDTTNASGTSNVVSELIAKSATTTTLSTTNATPTVGESFALTATITCADGATPTGTVSFTDNGSSLGTATLDGSGAGTITVSSLSPGTHSIVASYSGDIDDASGNSSPLAETVAQIGTVTTLTSDANPLSAGATLHLTATVALAPGATADGALTGVVTFTDAGVAIGTANIDGSGHATLAVSTLPVGGHTLAASYAGSTNYAASNSTPFTQQVQKTATTVSVTSSVSSILAGASVSFTATVTSSTGIPTGTATLYDGTTALQTQTLNGQGMASFSLSTLASGSHSISIGYSGDANYSASTSSISTETVNLAQPQITLSGPSGPVNLGSTVTLTGSITSPGIHPSGTLTLLDGATVIASQTVSSAGSFAFSTSSLSLGSRQLSVAYAGDSDNASANSPAITVTIQLAPTATALGVGSNPGTFGQAVTFTASVVSASPSATGSVNFFDGSTQIGAVSLSSGGTVTFTTSSLAFGTHSITAVYTGDAQRATSTSAALSERIVEPATATLASSANPSVAGDNVTFTATVVVQGSQVPTGSLIFRDNGTALGSVPLDANGAATLQTASLSVGSHTITVSYAGDTNVAAASASLSQTIQAATTNVALAASTNLVTFATPLTLTATLTTNGSLPTGPVTFNENGVSLGSGTINGQGIANFTSSNLSPGTHTIVANYAGDGRAAAAVSLPVIVVVKQTSALSVVSSSNPALTASSITLTATLTNSGAAAASGSVTFSDGTSQLGTAELNANGNASLVLSSLPSGTHSIVATYAGDGNDFASTSQPLSQVVNLRSTTTTLTSSQTDVANPQQVTLIAVVHGDGPSAPSGTVTFSSGNLPIGSAAMDANGVATLTILLETSSSTEAVVASYGGDAIFQSSTSAATQAAAGPATQFTLAVDPTAVTVVTKQHTTVAVSLTSIKGFNDTIQLGCLGLPFAATCTFSSPAVKLTADGTANVTLTIDTGDPLGIGAQAKGERRTRGTSPLLCLLPGLLIAGLSMRRRRLYRALLLAICCFTVALTLSGCAGLQGNGTPPGTYTFKVTASGQGSGATQSQTVTLTVTQ